MELGIPGDHGARLYMELGIPGDHGARLYMELESLEPKIRWVYIRDVVGGPGGVVCVVLIFEKRPLYLVLKGSKNFACGFKTTFFQKFLLKPHPNPFLLRFCVLKCGFNQICSKNAFLDPKYPIFSKFSAPSAPKRVVLIQFFRDAVCCINWSRSVSI